MYALIVYINNFINISFNLLVYNKLQLLSYLNFINI